jgi:hypothetical protein
MATDFFILGWFRVMLLWALLVAVPLSATAENRKTDSCFESGKYSLWDTDLQLARVKISREKFVTGVFHLRNRSTGSTLNFLARREGQKISMEQPLTVVEFQDLNGSWTTYIGVQGHDVATPPNRITLSPGEAFEFERDLFSLKVLDGINAQFRLALPVVIGDETICILSNTFQLRSGKVIPLAANSR